MCMLLSYSTVALYSRDRFNSIKQQSLPEKVLDMHQKCLNNAVRLMKEMENQNFDLQQAFKISYLAQISSVSLPACCKTRFC